MSSSGMGQENVSIGVEVKIPRGSIEPVLVVLHLAGGQDGTSAVFRSAVLPLAERRE